MLQLSPQDKSEKGSPLRPSVHKLPPLSHSRLSLQLQNIMHEAELNIQQSPKKGRFFHPVSDRSSQVPIHSSVQEFKSGFKKMFTNSKYGVNYMQKKIFHKLEPI